MMLAGTLGESEEEHLHLVELVHPEDAPGVAPGRARLAPEASGVTRVTQRELLRGQDLTLVERRESDLGGSCQVQPVTGDLVEVDLVGRQEACAVHRGLTRSEERRVGKECRSP